MGKTVITEEMFPEIVEQYNSEGKTAVYDLLRSRYGLQNPYFVLKRIKSCGKYRFDSVTDKFTETGTSSSDDVFMDLNELCNTVVPAKPKPVETVPDNRVSAMEKMVHELISDRLLLLSRYITLDYSTRTVLVDRTSLMADGYTVITH